MMGEFLFSIGYGGSLLVIGFVTRAFLRKMEVLDTGEVASKKSSYDKVGM
jgi:hypothetical protein